MTTAERTLQGFGTHLRTYANLSANHKNNKQKINRPVLLERFIYKPPCGGER